MSWQEESTGVAWKEFCLKKSCTDEYSQICGIVVSMMTFSEAEQKMNQHPDKGYEHKMKYHVDQRYWEKMHIQANKRCQLEVLGPRSLTSDVWNIVFRF